MSGVNTIEGRLVCEDHDCSQKDYHLTYYLEKKVRHYFQKPQRFLEYLLQLMILSTRSAADLQMMKLFFSRFSFHLKFLVQHSTPAGGLAFHDLRWSKCRFWCLRIDWI